MRNVYVIELYYLLHVSNSVVIGNEQNLIIRILYLPVIMIEGVVIQPILQKDATTVLP